MKTIILVLILSAVTFVFPQESSKKKKISANTKKTAEKKKPVKNAKESSNKSSSESSEEDDDYENLYDQISPTPTPKKAEETKTLEPAKIETPVEVKSEPIPEESPKETKTEPELPVVEKKDDRLIIAPPAFKGPNLIHIPSAQPLQKDILNFIFNHRFGSTKTPLYDFMGLDKGANTQLSLDYGLTDKLSLGLSRVNAFKTYEFRSKYFLLPQTNSFPVSLAVFGAVGVETEKQVLTIGPYILPASSGNTALDEYIKKKANEYELSYTDRTSYMGSILISRRFNEMFSLQVSPMFVHRNFVKTSLSNDRWGLNIAAKMQINKSISFMVETILTPKRDYIGDRYASVDTAGYNNTTTLSSDEINKSYNQPQDLPYIYLRNIYFDKPVPHYSIPLSFGLSFESGGHIYNLFVSNTRALAHTQLLRGADYDYRNGEWCVGFNINRFFSFAKEISEDNF